MICLTLEQIVAIHSLVIEETGGSNGVRDVGRLESVIATQDQEVFGVQLYSTLYEKAAAIIRGIICDHPFIDGNKRTGMLSGLTFLDINGVVTKLQSKELEDYAVQVATENLDVSDIAGWLESHSS